MEWCPMCQCLKPIQVWNYVNQWIKRCRDCNSSMGQLTVEDVNKMIGERDYYKKFFYESELEKCKKSQG